MASTSPGGPDGPTQPQVGPGGPPQLQEGPGKPPPAPDQHETSSARKSTKAVVNEKVGFFEQVWKSRPRSRSLGRKSKKDSRAESQGSSGLGVSSRSSRVETAYHGPR